jgi:predicted permease
MSLVLSTLTRLIFLFSFIIFGFALTRLKVIPDSSDAVLSKLENNLFTPCLVMGTFISEFRVDSLLSSWKPVALCALMLIVTLPLGIFLGKLFSKSDNDRKVYTYGLCFSNFGFMGLAVVQALFPEHFMEYNVFVLPLWIGVYGWGIPALLIPASQSDKSFKATLKRIANPMFVCMIIGAVVGVSGLGKPVENTVVMDIINTAGSCMSPLAMLLTGVTIAKLNILKVIKNAGIYLASVLRLIVIPLVLVPLIMLLPIENSTALCALCALSMPLGLSPVVVPAGYGEDTSLAAGMAVISHALSIITIPIIFAIFSGLLG